MGTPLLERFVGEARDLLQAAASALLVLEKQATDEAAINDVFRSVHTLKGSVGLFDFPAFTKLVHAGEDVLSAVRDGKLGLTSDLVDVLLDVLDQVGAWVDDIDGTGALAQGADGISKEMTARLRTALPADYGAAQASPVAAHAGDLTRVDWLGAIPEAERLSAFRAAMIGADLQAIEYVPLDDCFFSGEDPFILFRQLADLHSLVVEPTEPWPSMEALDPYRCVLRFRALAAAPPVEIETLFRYVVEQMRIAPISPHALVSVTGGASGSPVYGDFVDQARPLVLAGDWSALKRAVGALLQLTAPALLSASALRWLEAVLTAPAPDKGWVNALIDCIAEGEEDLHPLEPRTPPSADIPNLAAPIPTALGGLSPTAARILQSQRTILGLSLPAAGLASRLASVARTAENFLATEGLGAAESAAWSAAVDAAMVEGDCAPAIDLLDQWLLVGGVPPEAVTAAVMMGGG
ncbi:MAG: Hpt domain-containing protein, partial [Rhodospirillum sp.]|nr:Hpt domain-containing protein [Rhodospirillum sp.]